MLNPLQDAILQLFSILAAQGDDALTQQSKKFIITMLAEVLPQNRMGEALDTYDDYLATYAKKTGKKGLSIKSVRFLKKTKEISDKLAQTERHFICLRTMEFVTQYANNNKENLDFVKLITNVFLIDTNIYNNMYEVVSGSRIHSRLIKDAVLPESLSVLYLSEDEIYAKILDDNIPKQQGLSDKLYYRLQYQQSIKLQDDKKLFYSDILRGYIPRDKHPCKLHVFDLKYSIGKKHSFFYGMNLTLESPGLCAIVGPSGAGKSTLLKLMAGILKPESGSIEFSPSPPTMAFIPQEDSINPDLTIKEQLTDQAEKYGIGHPASLVEKIIQKTGLKHKAGILPGMADNSTLSGGERKRLSIGCGIISNPHILICDEPSSGLSFDDTNSIINLLRNIANENCLVICSLHQPDASIIAYFDNMLYLDEDGYPVFFGSPEQFPGYIDNILQKGSEKLPDKSGASLLAYTESRIREKLPDEFGRPTQKRKYPPSFWGKHNSTCSQQAFYSKLKPNPHDTIISPVTKTIKPLLYKTIISEIKAFFNRKSYSAMIMLYAPVMAIILAPICRFSETGTYAPLSNPHFPVFFIITVVVAMFSGLIFSLGELSRKQSEHKRNRVTEKSNTHVITAKICLLLPAGLLQSIMFSIISTAILKICYLFVPIVVMYFLLYCFATATGLILSALSKGKTWSYLLVPILLIPQILFSGAMIPWDKFPYHKQKSKAPLISRFFAAAWAYEGLVSDALYLYPETDYKVEKAYFLSTYFLQDVLPTWRSYCDTTTTSDAECINMLIHAMPSEIQEQLRKENNNSITSINSKLHAIFEASLDKHNIIRETQFPLLWHQIQHTELPPVEINHGKLQANLYPLYQSGNLSSHKAAELSIGSKLVRHGYVSWVFILLMGIIQYLIVFSKLIKWPWGK
ncbi:MAG: ATP-binding cassette domain-containing protein [Bacteroidales bacterium]